MNRYALATATIHPTYFNETFSKLQTFYIKVNRVNPWQGALVYSLPAYDREQPFTFAWVASIRVHAG